MKHLLIHSVKSVFRTGFFRGGMAMKLVAGLIGFYFLLMAAVLSLVLPELVKEVAADNQSVVAVIAQFLVYYLLVDILMRFLLQSLSGIKLQHYILLPISYRKLIHFMLGRSQFNFFNLLTLIITIPFALRAVAPEMGNATAAFWLIGMTALMLGNSFLAVYLKLLFAGSWQAALVMVGALVLFFGADVIGLDLLATTSWSESLFAPLLSGSFSLILLAYPMVAYVVCFRHLMANRYAESEKVAATDSSGFWSKLEWQGEGRIASLVAFEWKMMLRHKRTRTLLLFSTLFLAYGLIFYGNDDMWAPMSVFAGVFITGFAAMNYGQFLGAWEGRYFDGIFSRNFPIEDYYRAKFRLLAFLISFSYVLSLLYTLMDVKYFYLHTACFIFNIGFSTFIMLFFSTYQRKALDLNAGSAFNYQGTSATQFLVMLPLLVLPMLIYFMVDLLFGEMAGLAAIAGAGLISLAFYPIWIKGISDNFREKKHAMATGFRKKD